MHLEDRAAPEIENRSVGTEDMEIEDCDSRLLRGPANAGWKRSMSIHDPRDLTRKAHGIDSGIPRRNQANDYSSDDARWLPLRKELEQL